MSSTGSSVSYWFLEWLCPSQHHVLSAIHLATGIFTEAIFCRDIIGHWHRNDRKSCHTRKHFHFPFPWGNSITINSPVQCSWGLPWFEYPLNHGNLQQWSADGKWLPIKNMKFQSTLDGKWIWCNSTYSISWGEEKSINRRTKREIRAWPLLRHVQKRNVSSEREVTDKWDLGRIIVNSDHGTSNCSTLGSRKMQHGSKGRVQ